MMSEKIFWNFFHHFKNRFDSKWLFLYLVLFSTRVHYDNCCLFSPHLYFTLLFPSARLSTTFHSAVSLLLLISFRIVPPLVFIFLTRQLTISRSLSLFCESLLVQFAFNCNCLLVCDYRSEPGRRISNTRGPSQKCSVWFWAEICV